MKSTASRSPFQASAIAVALASSLFALTACGGGGGDSSTPSGTAGSAAGGTTAVASNAHGSAGASNSATSSGTSQGPGTVGSGTQQAQGAVDHGAQQGQGTAGSGLDLGVFKHGQLGSAGPGNGPSNSGAQAPRGAAREPGRSLHGVSMPPVRHSILRPMTGSQRLPCRPFFPALQAATRARTFGRVSVARSTLLPMGMFAPAAGGAPSGRSVRLSLRVTVGKMALSISSWMPRVRRSRIWAMTERRQCSSISIPRGP